MRSIWTALGELLSKEINENKVENTYHVEAIELIDFCLRDLRHCFDSQNDSNLSDYLRPILSSLLSGVNKLSNSMRNLENVIPALELIQQILSVLGSNSDQHDEKVVDLEKSVNNFNDFYVELCNVMTNFEDVYSQSPELLKLRLDTFKKTSQILNQI